MTDLFPETIEPMRYILHEETTKLSSGTTIRLLRCRNESTAKSTMQEIQDNKEPIVKVGRTKNELVASFYDDKKKKWKDFIRMTVADTLPEAMPEFLKRSRAEIERLLPRFKDVDKVERNDCVTVRGYEGFAEALQRK